MIRILYGADDYRVAETLLHLRASLGVSSVDGSSVVLDGNALAPGELLAQVCAVPFLSEHRLVVVEGLLTALAPMRQGRRKRKGDGDHLEPWRQVAADISKGGMPETTTLVLVEGELAANNAALALFKSIAEVSEFRRMDGRDVPAWIRGEAKRRGVRLDAAAERELAQMVGADLWTLSSELDKLATFSQGEEVGRDTVREMVSASHDTKMWELADAVLEGNEQSALKTVRRLRDDGDAAPLLASIIAGQFRRVALVKDMTERRVGRDELIRSVDPQWKRSYVVERVERLARRYSWSQLRAAWRRMLDADLNVKRGLQDDESSLQLLVHDLCALESAPGQERRERTASR